MKPPKSGNCSVPDVSTQPLMSMSELKEIFASKNKKTKQILIQEIKAKLNIVIEQKDDFSDFIAPTDHDYDLPYVVQCLMYFVTGNLCKKFQAFAKCETCKSEFFFADQNDSFITKNPIARIINNEEFDIQHPNIRCFKFLSLVEDSFSKNCDMSNVYKLVISEITQKKIEFPCADHAEEVLAFIMHFYLELRMREYAKIKMADQKKKNAEKKKLAKLYTT